MSITSWQAWKTLYPETTVLHVPETQFRDRLLTWMLGWMIPLAGLMKRRVPWHPLSNALDTRLPAMTPVFGVMTDHGEKAYPVSLLREQKVVEDTIGGTSLVIFYDPGLDTGGVFSRQADGRMLSFQTIEVKRPERAAMDIETGSTWDISGKANAGALQGRALTPLPHFSEMFWFSWAAFHPQTQVAPVQAE